MVERRAPARNFQELLVWQKAHQFVLGVYRISGAFPKQETYGLVSQMRRAAVSIPANICEGFRKKTGAEKKRFLNIAEASVEESRYYLILTHDLGYASTGDLMTKLEEESRLLQAYEKPFCLLSPDSCIPNRIEPWLPTTTSSSPNPAAPPLSSTTPSAASSTPAACFP